MKGHVAFLLGFVHGVSMGFVRTNSVCFEDLLAGVGAKVVC